MAAPTIRDIAALAGVSPSTVSRALAKPQMVAQETLDRVQQAAQQLGYQPHPVAQSLALRRTGNIGLIVPDIANPFFAPLVKTLQRDARAAGYSLFVVDTDEDADQEWELAQALIRQVDGLVIASSRLSDERIRELAERCPTVTLSRMVEGVSGVATPAGVGLTQAVELLAALGHTRIAWVSGPAASLTAAERQSSVESAAAGNDVELISLGPFSPTLNAGVRAAELVRARGVTAVMCYNDLIALGTLQQLQQRGVAVPGDVSVVGVDDAALAVLVAPRLSTVRIPICAAGAAALGILRRMLDGNQTPVHQTMDGELIVRESSGPARSDQAPQG
ncbi:LacI family DNA-binding transcriptional regulator [Micrococcoides hystricis]|uniref:LacI family DNA-binding transcriptional regulator n=1 Tax=Micrococcoides hystricis TaxID=1572761 RepID=A0ABV6PBE8_9MICC